MGIKWNKLGGFLVDVGVDSVNQASRHRKEAIKKKLRSSELTEEQRIELEEQLDKCEDVESMSEEIKLRYHDRYEE